MATHAPGLTPDQLFAENVRLTSFVLGGFDLPWWLRLDDARQAAHVGLWKAANAYDPSRGVQFSTFAVRCIWRELMHELRRGRSQRRLELGQGEPAPPLLDEPDDAPGPEEVAADREARDLLEDSLRALPASWRRVVELRYRRGLTLRAIAAELGVSAERARQIERAALGRLGRPTPSTG